MEFEEEATQPCTQPLGATKANSDDTTGILCVLFPTTPSAKATVARLLHTNQDFVFAQHAVAPLATNISTVTTSDEQLEDLEPTFHLVPETLSIALRFPPGPKDVEKGFCFGRNIVRCDVIIGDSQTTRRVSNVHFRIFVNEQHVLMLEDHSTNGTYVDGIFLGPILHTGHGRKPEEQRSKSRQLSNGSEIHILKGPKEEEIRFMVRIPKSNGTGFLGDGDDFSTFDPNNIPQVTPTAGPSAYLNYVHLHPEMKKTTDENEARVAPNRLAMAQPQPWVGANKFHLMDAIGHGAFATVQKAVRRHNGEPVAIKILNRRTFAKTSDRTLNYKKEVEILEQLKHPNIVQYHECLEDEAHIYIVMEYIGGGDLNDYINKHGKMEEHLVQEVTRQILRGIMYVHQRGISHRDIKPDNILLVSENPIEVKISDFGLAKMVRDEETFLKTFCGTMLYLAPEVYPRYHMATLPVVTGSKRKHGAIEEKPKRERRYNQAVDMWSIGVVIFVLLTGKPPFEAKNQDEIYERIMTGNFDVEVLRKAGIENQTCVDFLARLLEVNPEIRIREQEALRHPWLAQDDDSDSFFSSSMEVDDDLAMHYQKLTENHSSGADDGDGSWQEVVADSEGEEAEGNPARRRRSESLEWSEGDNAVLVAAPGGTQTKGLLNYNDPNSQERGDCGTGREDENLSFDFAGHEIEGVSMLHSNGAGLIAFAQNSAQGSSSILPFQEFVSEGSIRSTRTVTPHTVPPVSSQPSDVPANASRRDSDNETQDASIPSSSAHRLAASKLAATTPITMSPQRKMLSPKSKILSPKAPLVRPPSADSQKTPTPSLNFFSKAISDLMASTVSSYGLADTKILSSTNTSIAIPRTVSQVQMPPPKAPAHSPEPQNSANGSPARKIIVVRASQEGILDYTDKDTYVQAPYWGKLVPLENSLKHPTVLCQRDSMIFGRRSMCTVLYTDGRISKKHCGITPLVPSPAPEGGPPPRPRAYLKCSTSNLRVNNEKVEKGRIIKVYDGDEIIFFYDAKLNERLAFKLCLAGARKEQNRARPGDETTEAEKSSSSENCDSDTLMNG